MADAERIRNLLKNVLDKIEPLPGRITELLVPVQQRRPITADEDPKRRLEFIKDELNSILAALHQPGPDYVNDLEFKAWLYALNPVVTDIGNYLDKATASSCCFPGLTLSPFPHGLKDMEESLCVVAERPCRYRHVLQLTDDAAAATPESAEAAGADQLLGIQGNKLLRWLRDENHQTLKAISLFGAAGVGKTALATEIYRQVRGDFDLAMVVKISQRPDMTEPLGRILSEIQQPPENTGQGALVDQIKHYLQDKRYLVLIDDIWKESDWNDIKQAFPENNRGSRIIVTTSITKVAMAIGGYSNVHRINPLSQVDSRFLLFRDAFGSEDRCPKQLLQVCELILRRCGGIPLFICGMADWLKKHMDSDGQNVPPMLEAIGKALSPTYDILPYNLKLPLLYISMYPHGYVFEKKCFARKMTAEWLAESIKDVEECIEQLIERNVITSSQVEGELSCHWQVNYFMHQFFAIKSAEKGFICASGTIASAGKPRRLSLHLPDQQLTEHLGRMDLYPTRSLAISGSLNEIPLVRFSCLMVMDLEGWLFLNDAYVLDICNTMYLLRYLSLRRTGVKKLPPEIKELCKLETLDLSHTEITELPSQMCELPELRRLDLSSTPVSQLPVQVRKMRQLRHLLFGVNGVNTTPSQVATKMPEDIRGLEVVRTLATLDLSQCPASFVHSLGGMDQLEVLVITWSVHQSTNEDFQKALLASMGKWSLLTCLTIHCQLGCSMDFLHPLNGDKWSGHLKNLPLEKFNVTGGRFLKIPEWFRLLGHIAFIEITVCSLEEGDLSILGSLSSLKSLVLGMHLLPEAIILVDAKGFRMLQRLHVRCRVPWISFQEGTMPLLTCLELNFGGGLADEGNVPCGITKLQSLSEVVVRYSPQYCNSPNVIATVEAVKKGVADHPNIINLLINGIHDHDQQEEDDEKVECPDYMDIGCVLKKYGLQPGALKQAMRAGADALTQRTVRRVAKCFRSSVSAATGPSNVLPAPDEDSA